MIGEIYTEEEFRDIVAQDVREVAQAFDSRVLRSKEVVAQWWDALTELKRDIELQRTRKAANLLRARVQLDKGYIDQKEFNEFKAQDKEWRASSGNLLKGVERRMAEAKRLKEKYDKEAA